MRIGYVPIAASLQPPGDRRRFVHYARARGLQFELASPEGDYDLVVLSSAADVTRWARVSRGKLVFDLVDSYFAIPRTDWRGLLRGTAKYLSRQQRHFVPSYWAALAAMCRRADAVVCSTEEQHFDIRRYCKNVHVILDVQSAAATSVKRDFSAHWPFRLVWEGLPFTLHLLFALRPVLEALHQQSPLELHVVTNPSAPRWLARFGRRDTRQALAERLPGAVFHEWTDATFSDVVTSCDLALIPLNLDDPFTRGKPENKLLLFWRVGMPVVASASPAYDRAMRGAGEPLSCTTLEDWKTTIGRAMNDQSLRERAARSGREWAERTQSEAQILARWDAVFRSLGFDFARS